MIENSTKKWYYIVVGNRHRKTFEAIFQKPDRSDIGWDDFLNLLIYLGASLKTGSGSAVGVKLNGNYAVFHKPHPGNEIYKSDLKRIRRFLTDAGVDSWSKADVEI